MKINEPIGNPNIGPLLVRISLGTYFIMAGFLKLENLHTFIKEVQAMNVVKPHIAQLYATLLPYLEITCGVLLCIGFWTTLAAIVSTMLLASFIYALKLFPGDEKVFNKDIILLCASMSILFTGAGSLSIDKFRRSS